MIIDGKIKGKYVYLRSVMTDDAMFTLSLRQDHKLTKYLPKLNISLEQQKLWIVSQQEKSDDYFFLVNTIDNKPIGTVSIYNISGDTSEAGRLVLLGDPFQNTEAVLLLFIFAFDVLGLKMITGYTNDENKRAERFNSQFGVVASKMKNADNEESKKWVLLTQESFHKASIRLQKLLYGNIVTIHKDGADVKVI